MRSNIIGGRRRAMTQGTGFTAMAGPKAEGEALQVGVGMLG
jgi:hypothetical protein